MAAQAMWKWDPTDLPAGTRVGHWVIVGRLGRGGYGVVYLVRGVGVLRRHAALKLALQPGPVSRRLEREVELLSRVKHPNVARLLDAGHWLMPGTGERLPFLVMEHVPGPGVEDWLRLRDGRVHEALTLFKQSALALHAVHEAGAFHRDVKGENLLVDEDGRLVLVDLGVGDYEGAAPLTGTLLPPGTSTHRSPEALRFQRENLDDFHARYEFRLADELYALGVTWYRALTHAFPFEDQQPVDAHQARLGGQLPTAPATLNPCVPQGVSALVLRLLSPRPEERPASAREVAEVVDALLRQGGPELRAHLFPRNEEVMPHARPTEDGAPRRKPTRRGGAFVLVAALVAVLAVGLRARSRLPSALNPPTQEGPPMRESKTPSHPSLAPEAQPSALDLDFMRSLAAAVCLVTTGCASVPVTPTWPQECPKEALTAMGIRGFGPGRQGYLTVDINRPGGASEFDDFRAGPLVSVIYDKEDAANLLPVGTKLYGHLWTGGEKIQGYWTQAELPWGQKMPVCMVLGFDERGGYWKEPGPHPGTFKISRQAAFTVTRRFERPE
jgi:serine/threonine-protein kinase